MIKALPINWIGVARSLANIAIFIVCINLESDWKGWMLVTAYTIIMLTDKDGD